MNNLITLDKFLSFFTLPHKPSLDEFKSKARILYDTSIGSSVSDFINRIEKKNPKDLRVINNEDWWNGLYEMFVVNREQFLSDFYQIHFAVSNTSKYFNFEYSRDLIDDVSINGTYNNTTTKLLKNLHFKTAYTTKKNSADSHLDFLGIVKRLVETYEIRHSLLIPMSYEAITEKNAKKVFAILRGTTNRPSFFNPYTCGYLLDNLFIGEKILTPVLDWSSYALGFLNSNWKEYVGIDVMPSVATQTEAVLSETQKNQQYKIYCQPSEELLNSDEWMSEYQNHFDLVFFSPPYYTLELYSEGGNSQSVEKYKSYTDWLNGYWHDTVMGCYHSMATDSIFTFVISDSKDTPSISLDMLEIAKKWFNHIDTYNIHWNSFNVLDAKKMKSGNVENLFILQKGNGKIKSRKKTALF